MDSDSKPGRTTDGPVFAGGLPGSGLAWLGAVLRGCPDLALFPAALPLWTEIFPRVARLHPATDQARREVVNLLFDHPKRAAAGLPDARRELLDRLTARNAASRAEVAATILDWHAESLGRPRWGQVAPRLEFHADALLRSYPDARFLHLIRDPRVLPAVRNTPALKPWRLRQLAREWAESAALARENAAKYPDRYLVLPLERAIDDAEPQSRRVLEFLGATSANGRLVEPPTPSPQPLPAARAWRAWYVELLLQSELARHGYAPSRRSRALWERLAGPPLRLRWKLPSH